MNPGSCAACAFVDALHDGVIGFVAGHAAWANEAARRMLGFDPIGKRPDELSPRPDALMRGQGSQEMFRRADDPATRLSRRASFPVDCVWLPGANTGDGTMIFLDATVIRDLENGVRHSYRDVTGLLSREGFHHLAARALQRKFSDALHVVLALRVEWPDREEHGGVEEIDRDFARRLVLAVRGGDLVAHETDWFYVLLVAVKEQDNIFAIARRIAGAIGATFHLRGELVCPTVSVGVAVHGMDGNGIEELLYDATAAAGRSGEGVHFANAALQERCEMNEAHLAHIRDALRTGRVDIAARRFSGKAGRATLLAPFLEGASAESIWREAFDGRQTGGLLDKLVLAATHAEGAVVIMADDRLRAEIAARVGASALRVGRVVAPRFVGGQPGDARCLSSLSLVELPAAGHFVLASQQIIGAIPPQMREIVELYCNLYIEDSSRD